MRGSASRRSNESWQKQGERLSADMQRRKEAGAYKPIADNHAVSSNKESVQ